MKLPHWAIGLTALLCACGESGSGINDSKSGGGGIGGSVVNFSRDPALATPKAALDANLRCTEFTHPDKAPVLLIHGTFTAGYEQYDSTYIPILTARGFDVCTVTYPDRGFIDQQVSAEYIVNAIREVYRQSGNRKVAMIGHSQGASMPRWALKWWPTTRDLVADFVLHAGPNHGTSNAPNVPGGATPESFYQFSPTSRFTTLVNQGDETPGDIDYTSIYTAFDELVQPYMPVPTAALDWQQNNPKVLNLLLQDLCPARVVDHVSIGLTDSVTIALSIDAISNPGPANIERAGGASLCAGLPFDPASQVTPAAAAGLINAARTAAAQGGPPNMHSASQEPPTKAYALAGGT